MVYHISPFYYPKIDVNYDLFLERLKAWDYNTLITQADFDENELIQNVKISRVKANNQAEGWYPTLNSSEMYRQIRPGETPAKSRLLLSLSYWVKDKQIEMLKARGFQVAVIEKTHATEESVNLVIIAEENVNIEDAKAWASKFDIRKRSVAQEYAPLIIVQRLYRRKSENENLDLECFDTQEVIDYYVEHGIDKGNEKYSGVTYKNVILHILKRLENVKNNEKFNE